MAVYVDVAAKPGPSDIVASTGGGTVTNAVRVVIHANTTKEEAYQTLKTIAEAVLKDSFTIS